MTDELHKFLRDVTREDFNRRILARGEARAIIRRAGKLPEGAPIFDDSIDADLSGYGFSLLQASLALLEDTGTDDTCRNGFFKAGNAFEALVRNGSPEVLQRGFWRAMGAGCYYLAGYSAMAFSFLAQREEDPNFAPGELVLAQLLLRDLQMLREETRERLIAPTYQDDTIFNQLDKVDTNFDDTISDMLTTTIYRAFALFEFALSTGEDVHYKKALNLLKTALRVAGDCGFISLWWIIRVIHNVINDLWYKSFHRILPMKGPQGATEYKRLRKLFLASLYVRDTAEIELWPSQLQATKRAIDIDDDLVIALPTSAGKTRIAEICALMSLSTAKRVLIVTPLRALSAQTERLFRRTFGTLGFSVSSLYGVSGMLQGDEDALRTRNIVVATPEKLDFALRSNPALINDVGLIVLDEGHLIGLSERELRYEVLVQKLLKRTDVNQRRLVCLSAILPDGEPLDDLTAWIRSDAEGLPVKSEWRPTRQRFGTLTWTGQAGRLSFEPDESGPYINKFVEQQQPIYPRRTPFPNNNQELTLAAAWQFADEGKHTLIYCTQRNYVNSYAKRIIDLSQRGFLPSLLDDTETIAKATAIGAEWLGVDHPAVLCLQFGVAIHHAQLPKPFLREVERLLSNNILTVAVTSPTLAQGLNLNIAVLLLPSLYRESKLLPIEEFANVAGRAGRAFVDMEGLIVHVMYESKFSKKQAWRNLMTSTQARSLESGLIQIAAEILQRLLHDEILNQQNFFEHLANSKEAWDINEGEEINEPLESLLEKLDTILLSLIQVLDAESANLPQLIDEALNGSLWARQIARRAEEDIREHQIELFGARARLIWNNTTPLQRRAYFAMGVGFKTGSILDAIADELLINLDRADSASLSGTIKILQDAMIHLAEKLLVIKPFAPVTPLPEGWQNILSAWLSGKPIHEIGIDNIYFIEDAFVYRLVWALEALRVRRIALGWNPEIMAGTAVACLESGLPRFTMAMLVRAGLPSRAAALFVVDTLNPIFIDSAGILEWLKSKEVVALTNAEAWPSTHTAACWTQFRDEMLSGDIAQRWVENEWRRDVEPNTYSCRPVPDQLYRVEIDHRDNSTWVCTPDFKRVVKLRHTIIDNTPSVLYAKFEENCTEVIIKRFGRSGPIWSDE